MTFNDLQRKSKRNHSYGVPRQEIPNQLSEIPNNNHYDSSILEVFYY